MGIMVVLAGAPAALAATYTSPAGTVRAGVNYLSLPAMPGSTDPAVLFAGIPLDGKISYWCRQTQEWHVYPTSWPPTEPFMWHMGYRLEADQDYTITFQGNQPPSLRSTCLTPIAAGYAFVSQPYDFEAFFADFLFESSRNPGVKVSTVQAAANGWIEPYLIEGAQDSGVHITLDGAGGTSTTVKPWHGYWVKSKVGPPQGDKLTIYWPTVAAPEPATLAVLGVGGLALLRRRARRA